MSDCSKGFDEGFDDSNTIESELPWMMGEYVGAAARWIADKAVEFIVSNPYAPISLAGLYAYLDDRDRSLLDLDGLSTPAHGVELLYGVLLRVAEDPRIRVADTGADEIAFAAKIPAGE
ncbi:hypothetical protein [Mycobacterium sp. 852014-52144_SCH5372336]|uniref:hypothetical protein n=1 Tax=Mycobacterium sp. 852014-52144_SCH5372336 TaxID=1834115 RepID=UPI0007FB85EA|nr:hypothetical protein [Mycobacterium sp. 852014-52144_SCH5372336]OBB71571.1 hypothetical protein A5759_20570 [Mycobacterium sp. 852014-52144_SCH5372336]